MARRNLCVVFGPTIVCKPIGDEDGSLVNEMNATFNVLELLMGRVSRCQVMFMLCMNVGIPWIVIL